MSTAIHSVKVTALKGAEIKLTVRSLEGNHVSFCPILALRCPSCPSEHVLHNTSR
ncbi:hypothetical protein [Nannocystis pusilla]|uniref:Uncharacterized protein n=1 Tax=Nannocystis pusilla TaxID=889268 RepID=A0ABS7TK54_9BACT|nr:hypothetical protein [Nannocystis pusilla]MBZ5708612.1 hypothetical protein [Nannocystis pusilla]